MGIFDDVKIYPHKYEFINGKYILVGSTEYNKIIEEEKNK